ncbi:MAG: LacI family DNA-binding transcriptional regulator [Caldilineaceae bacterium]|nr:LacI family DNA-binding transcriptional regulator [Caldilineaceae bacterium]
MPATIEDVAKLAGVSTATVSRALRGLPNVIPSTQERVFHAAQELGYVIPTHLSRQVLGRKVIGLVAPLVDQWFYSKLLTAMELELLNLGYDAVSYHIDGADNQTDLLRQLIEQKLVDGLIINSIRLSDGDVALLDAEITGDQKLAVVTVESAQPEFDSVSIDNMAAAQMATRHLLDLGHRRIGFVSGVLTVIQYAIPLERQRGYEQALAEAGVRCCPELIVNGNFSFRGGAEAMRKLFGQEEPPTAVFSISDEMAIGGITALHEMGLKVPEDVSVVGFDDHSAAWCAGLTTVQQPIPSYGVEAARLVVSRLESQRPLPPRHISFTPELIIRNTTARRGI